MRQQLTLFVPPESAAAIERVRATVDPIQHRLIAAHVTLCREDELSDFAEIEERLGRIAIAPLTLTFGRPVAFSDHGLLLPCIDGEAQFHALRRYVLNTAGLRLQKPHITIAHPRNFPSLHPEALDAAAFPERQAIAFPAIHWIEQRDGGPWRILQRFEFAEPNRS